MTVLIRRICAADKPEWLRMRLLLWPHHLATELLAEMDEILANSAEAPVFVAALPTGKLAGFLEGGTRKYADGCETGPVGYIEGWYVDQDLRRAGVGGRLIQAMENWAKERGLTEMGSDTWLDNGTSITAHVSLGYEIKEHLVHFAKKL
ncbi:MAG: GNAT family N-acetyltransferase [Chloroflexi bacterium]|nr:GNAT family N-acetyltransferase [Chloroflexota bacterium]